MLGGYIKIFYNFSFEKNNFLTTNKFPRSLGYMCGINQEVMVQKVDHYNTGANTMLNVTLKFHSCFSGL